MSRRYPLSVMVLALLPVGCIGISGCGPGISSEELGRQVSSPDEIPGGRKSFDFKDHLTPQPGDPPPIDNAAGPPVAPGKAAPAGGNGKGAAAEAQGAAPSPPAP